MVGTTATTTGEKMSNSRPRNSDMSLFADVLEPFRRVIGVVGGEDDRDKRPTAARLSFSEQDNTTGKIGKEGDSFVFGKRKSSAPGASAVTPDKRARCDSTSLAASPWEAKRLRADLIAAKAQITKLESRISQQHVVRKEMQILFEEERAAAAEQARRDKSSIAALEERVALGRRRETELKELLAESEREKEELKDKWEKERESLHKQIAELKDKVLETNVSSKGQVSEMKKDMDELLQALEGAQGEVEVLKREVTRQTARAQECAALRTQTDKQALEIQQLSSQLRELQYERDSFKDWQQQAKTAQKRLSNMAELEREVGRLRATERTLRDAAANKLVLEEQVATLTSKLNALQPLQQELHAAKVRLSSVESQLEEWGREGRARGADTPALLGAALDSALHRELAAAEQLGAVQSQLAQLTDDLSTAKFERDKATTKLSELQAVKKSQDSLVHRLQRRLLLVTRERDSYRQQLDSYEKELMICGEGAGRAALMAARVEQLERSLQSYRDLLDSTDQEAHTTNIERLRAEASRWREEAEAARRDIDKLRQQRDQLEKQLERHLQPATKVLHLENNPAAGAHKDLQSELEAALNEIKRLRGEGGARGEEDSQTVATLRKQLDSSRIKLQRIKEEFTVSAQEYRDVCYMLLGFKIDRTGSKNYRLSSMYAESPDDTLLFTLREDGIEMVQTEYSATLEELAQLHLHQHGSIPLFLSALTLHLFSLSTMQ